MNNTGMLLTLTWMSAALWPTWAQVAKASSAEMRVAANDAKPLAGNKNAAVEDPAHEELRALRRQISEAINKTDMDALMTHLDEEIVVTWMDGRVSHGPQEVRKYIDDMTKGEQRKVNSYTTQPEADDLTHLYGNTGIASGHSRDRIELTDGQVLEVNARWTGTLVKNNGQWKLASLHASAGMFDNPVLHMAVRSTMQWTGGVAVAAGLLIGFVVAKLLGRRRA